MTKSQDTLPSDRVPQSILLIRGQRVMLDVDLALVYGVTTKRLNEQVTRNQDRFPADFMFRLTRQEKTEVVANCDHLRGLKFSAAPPRAFTEHGAIMLAAVLSSPVAIHERVVFACGRCAGVGAASFAAVGVFRAATGPGRRAFSARFGPTSAWLLPWRTRSGTSRILRTSARFSAAPD